MEYTLTEQTSEKWSISERRKQKPCEESRIHSVIRFSRIWATPKDTEKPPGAWIRSERRKVDK